MTMRTTHMTWLSRTHLRPTRRIFSCIRGYASGTSDNPEWFTNIRSELLNRPAILRNAYLEAHIERRLANTLAPFLPQNNAQLPFKKDPLPLGHHLVWFNVDLPPDQLLPDGTDALHSPGGEWVRRMWAGGSVQVRPSYHHPTAGVRLGKPLECLERITDVQLRGDKDSEKIFVTIDRAFADQTELRKLVPEWRFDKPAKGQNEELFASVIEGVAQQPIMTERRILVFLKDKTAEELEAIKAGDLAPTRYLKAPETHDFSFSFTPTRFLLFNYSALTHNAHLIHYDKDYALNVEGHRNLLVHGPLTLTLLLQAMANFLAKKEGEKHVILSIDYRNMAPLYCDEEMKICGSFKKTIVDESTYEIWIEGPTGGMAVKGIVHTKKLDKGMPELDETAKPYTAAEFNALPIRRVTAPPARKDSARDAPEVKPLKIKKLTSLHIRTTWDAEFRGPRRRRAKGNSDGQPEGQPDGQPDGKADVDSS